jgi:hypothetical protein
LQNNKDKPAKSLTRPIANSANRYFSTFDDLAKWAVSLGRAASVEEVRQTPSELWGNLLFEWYTQGQIACVFAVKLARAVEKTSWVSAVVTDEFDADVITGIVDAAAARKDEAIQLIFPGTGSAAQAAEILTALSHHKRWLCADVGVLDGEPHCATRQIGLRWISPDGTYESWALGIADYAPTAFTRRFTGAPFIALVLRPTPPVEDRAPPVVGDAGLKAAHLAHLDDGLGSNQEQRDKWTEATRLSKRALLNPEPLSRARAKVTFAFEANDYDSMMQGAKVVKKAAA